MIAALLLLSLQSAPSFTCGPDPVRVFVEDGWIQAIRGRDEFAEAVRVRIWGPWLHESGCAQLDDDAQEEIFVISRTIGTGPYYRIQLLDFARRSEGPEPDSGVHVWSYGSEGKPAIEDGRVLLGKIPVDRWTGQGPPIYLPHRLTPDGLLLETEVGEGESACAEVAPTLSIGPRSERLVTLPLELFASGATAVVEIVTSVGEAVEGEDVGEDDCAMAVAVKNSDGVALGAAELPVTYCGGVGLWSASAWRLAGGGALAAFEFGNEQTRHVAGDLHIVYLGRDGSVRKLTSFPEISGRWSSSTGSTGATGAIGAIGAMTAQVGARLFERGSSTILAVERTVTSAGGGAAPTRTTEWLELSTRRDELLRLPDEPGRECGAARPAG